MRAALAAIAVSSLAGPLAASDAPDLALERRIEIVMGTALEIAVFAPTMEAAAEACDAAFAEAKRLEALLSHYRPDSPLSCLNETAGQDVTTDPELVAYLRRAQRDGQRTNGAFDVTVGPLIALHRDREPTTAEIAAAVQFVGIERVRFPADDRVQLDKGMRLDPGGDGKGVAVDAMVERLRARGIEHAFLNFGESSIYGLGHPPGESGWRVVVRDPDEIEVGELLLHNAALSVSTALPPPEDPDEERRGHVVDPRTGELVTSARTTVVVSPSASDAEVLSTALVVDGPDGFLAIPQFEGAQAALLGPGGERGSTPGFDAIFDPVE